MSKQGTTETTVVNNKGNEMKNTVTGRDDSEEMTKLSDAERIQMLMTAEKAISKDAKAFVTTGEALLTIQDRELYEGSCASFDEYCKKRWDMCKAQVYRLIKAAKAYRNVSKLATIPPPENEAQIRPMTKLGEEQQKIAWGKAAMKADGKRVSANLVAEVVAEMLSGTNNAPKKKDDSALKARKQGRLLKTALSKMEVDKLTPQTADKFRVWLLEVRAVMDEIVNKIEAQQVLERKAA
jgi:hypothetical protein